MNQGKGKYEKLMVTIHTLKYICNKKFVMENLMDITLLYLRYRHKHSIGKLENIYQQ